MEELIAAVERLLRSLRDPLVDEFLLLWPRPPWRRREVEARSLPVVACLEAVSQGRPPEAAAELDRLRAEAGGLAWAQTYSAAEVGAAFLERYGWTELVGLRGPVASDALAAGFLLLGPGTEYPAHHHAAEEIYVPLSGVAFWRRGEEGWRIRSPGEPIHHPSGQSHAMRTAEAALVALYLWRHGDLAEKSRLE